MTRILPLALAAVLLAGPSIAAGISMDMPNLSFPDPQPTVSTKGCPPEAAAPACAPRG
jgi:hypothetical protein